jgi:hypothetical protein
VFRKPWAWVVLVLVAAGCAAYSFTYFPSAFPLVSLDLRMDRDAAMEAAGRLAQKHGWGPEEFRQAAAFPVDGQVRSFVELEGGGREVFISMVGGELYSPYTWRVRLFQTGETNETQVRFTPAGEPYGFRETLPEDQAGAALSEEEARALAESAVAASWGISLGDYELVEHRQEVKPGERVDHTLVYERPDVQAGEGRYRLRLVVGGDRLTELTHLVKVPEAFERRFREMRSFNETIAVAGTVLMIFLFLGGGMVGLFFLLRQRRVLWREPLLWGFIVSSAMVLLSINQWPLTWMSYDTALSSGNFLLQRVLQLVGQFFGLGALYVLSFMAAESLTRRAFPQQIQLWKSWTSRAASSPAMLGRTVSGYLLVAVNLAFVVLFYSFAFEKLGWWSPSDSLLDPNVLATPFPWLASVAISLQAGFWEECLFRAVPLAGAALLGARFGGRRYWIFGALVLQALVFGAGHAAYPTQPSYARVVELFLPAMFWGVIYLAYGLIPVIVLHVTFDVVLISLPLWVSSAPGLLDDRVLVVALTLIPLWAVLLGRWRQGRWRTLDGDLRNGAWAAAPAPEPQPVILAGPLPGLSAGQRRALWTLGAAGAVVWLLWLTVLRTPPDAPPIHVGRAQAIAAADQALSRRGLAPPETFRTLAEVQANKVLTHRYVRQEGDRDLYDDLLGRYLPAPRWRVRYAGFEGDVAARAEEFQVWVDAGGTVTRVRHQLPEAMEGADLDEEQARALARSAVVDWFGLSLDGLEEVEASPAKEANRTDWTFQFSNPGVWPLDEGEARVGVLVAGNEIADAYRYVHLPETWERDERNRGTLLTAIQVLCVSLSLGFFVSGAVLAIIRWSRKQFGVRVFVLFSLALVALRSVLMMLNWPSAIAQFQTAVSFQVQAGLFIVVGLLAAAVTSGVIGLDLGLVERMRPPSTARGGLLSGVALGLLVAGASSVLLLVSPPSVLRWPAYDAAGAAAPWLTTALGSLSAFITTATLMLLVFVGLHRWTAGWTTRRESTPVMLLLVGLILAGRQPLESITGWLLLGTLVGASLWVAYVWVLRFELSLIPPAAAVLAIAANLSRALGNAYPGAMAGSLVAVVLIAVAAVWWHRTLTAPATAQESNLDFAPRSDGR